MLNLKEYAEKRGFIRMCVDCPVSFQVEGEAESCQGTVKDLSASGMRIACDRDLALGTLLEVTITPDKPIVPPLRAQAEVVRNDPGESGDYQLGLAIQSIVG